MQRVLDEVAFWDMYYEHCSCISLSFVGRLFRQTGFEVVELLQYDDQYLLIGARPASGVVNRWPKRAICRSCATGCHFRRL